jgi:hypothetical protein
VVALTRRIFKSGEKFQLGVKVNHPSYVYILNEAPDGTIKGLQLFIRRPMVETPIQPGEPFVGLNP